MAASVSMKTRDGRFAYEAAGDPALPPLVFLHGIGGAARAWRGQLESFGDRYRAIAWDMPGYGGSAPLPTVSIATLADALQDFLRAGRRDKTHPGRAFDRRHDRPAIAGEKPEHRRRRRARADQSGVRQARRRLAEGISSTRGSVRSIAAKPWFRWRRPWSGNWSATIPTQRHGACARLHGRRSRGDLSRHHAGADGVRPAQRAQEYRGADAGAVGLQGQECAGADDGEDGDATFHRQPMSNSKAPAISSIWNAPAPSTPRSINS